MPNICCFCVYVNAGTDMNKSDKNEQTRAREWKECAEAEAGEGFLDYGLDLCSTCQSYP